MSKKVDPIKALHLNAGIMDMTHPEHVKLVEQKAFEADPVALIRAGYLMIKTKDGNMEPLRLNSTQKKILDTIQAQRRKKLPIRICILKARQLGTSTVCEGLVYAFCSQRGASNGLVLADDDDGAKYIFTMNEIFHEGMEVNHPHLAPKRKRCDERRLEFLHTRSTIRIETAGNKRAGRKYTFRYAHLSEVAYYNAFNDLMAGLKPSIPDRPETLMILETTANGMNDFSKFWWTKKKQMEEGKTDWVMLFLSWKDHEEYRRAFSTPAVKAEFEASMTKDERLIMKDHALTLEQMNWRRHVIIEDFNGDTDKFEVEFPLTDRQAFKSSQKRVFVERMTDPQRSNLREPKAVGELEIMNRRPVFLPDPQGYLKVYDEPKPERRYVIAADSCESAISHDEACAQVIDRATWTQVAHLHGHIAPDDLAKKLFALGQWYNFALIAPERNGPGLVTVTRLAEMFYPNICRTKKSVVSDNGIWTETEEFGFHTNARTKPEIIDSCQRALRDLLVVLKDKQTLDELETFVVKAVNKEGYAEMGAEDGFYDDCVMSLAIAIWYARQLPDGNYREGREIPRIMPQSRTGY